MKPMNQAAYFLLFQTICVLCATAPEPAACRHKIPQNTVGNVAPSLFQQMAGTWHVEQQMWPASGAAAIPLQSAVARRRLVRDAFLEESMESMPGSKDPFTRIAYFNYNAVSRQYEYFSLDTRAPQMMNERSHEAAAQSGMHDDNVMTLYGGRFVAPLWGKTRNAAFRYRLTIGKVEKDRQVVRLYLTPLPAESSKEFLAFEYVYTRQR